MIILGKRNIDFFLSGVLILICDQVIPGKRGTYCFWPVSAVSAAVSAAAFLPTLFNFLGKPLKLLSPNHTWFTYGCGKIVWHPSWWPWVKVTKLMNREVIYLVPMIKWEPQIQSLQNLVGISLSSCFPPAKILAKFCPKIFFVIFFCIKF